MVFTNYAGTDTEDLSTDGTYGDRILLIDHTEEPYNEYATIVLKNYDRGLPTDLTGYWTEIGYGDGSEYCGDGSNGGADATARLWVKHHNVISAGGKLFTILELEGMWVKLRETLMRVGTPPYYIATESDFGGASTPYDIIDYILTNEIDPAMSLDALAEDDGIMDTLEPTFSVNEMQPFEDAGTIIYELIKMTKSYLRAKAGMAFEVKYPQDGDSVDITYYNNTAPKFYEASFRHNLVIPNQVLLFANAGDDGLWTDIITGQADDSTSQADYGIVPYIATAPYVTSQADATARAEAILARIQMEIDGGYTIVMHDCQIELYDKVQISDSRGL
jgi:hypothetical protein